MERTTGNQFFDHPDAGPAAVLDRHPSSIEQEALALLDADDTGILAATLLGLSLRHLQAVSGVVFLSEGAALVPVAASAIVPELETLVREMNGASAVAPDIVERLSSPSEPVITGTGASRFGIAREVSIVWVPLRHRSVFLGVIYAEYAGISNILDGRTVGTVSMFARQAAATFAHLRLTEAMTEEVKMRREAETSREAIYDSMLKHQRIGKMGDFRFNTRTLLSKGSYECYRMFGYRQGTDIVEYDLWMDKLHPDDRVRVHEQMAAAFAKQVPLRFEYRIVKDGKIHHILSEGHPEFDAAGDLLYCGVVVDITEQKAAENVFANLQTELASALRLASLGELAGSVVHEVNQPLTAMMTNASACRRWLTRSPADVDEAREAADQVVREGERAIEVMAGLQNLARGMKINPVPLQLNGVVTEVLALVRNLFERASVGVTVELEEDLPPIVGDRVQLQQVIFNTVRNSVDAMRSIDSRPRAMKIETWRSGPEEVVLAIRDNGVGMQAERLEFLFHPLFTTKDDGLGLGLSICRRIVRAHHGQIWAERNNEHGLTVNVSLPIQPGRQDLVADDE